jgi:elongation factor Ts
MLKLTRRLVLQKRFYSNKISIELVKELRQMTLSPLGKCKQALQESEGDIEKAKEWLRKQGIKTANLKGDRGALEGLVSEIKMK